MRKSFSVTGAQILVTQFRNAGQKSLVTMSPPNHVNGEIHNGPLINVTIKFSATYKFRVKEKVSYQDAKCQLKNQLLQRTTYINNTNHFS
ncbi:hypothetical protein RCL_jg24141.t1 [Rhizophagus clarus]|uniref:Uncharacterized protein n=1 Tax=Rhizophagus clarus TaxID=94130 RepID=A0A8H3LG35_9GLOM|nr:hypothetical protein RCL_jg24141.t1 [Rhizophagus clarus]